MLVFNRQADGARHVRRLRRYRGTFALVMLNMQGGATRLHIFCYFCAEKVRPKYEAYHTPYIINGNHCARNNRHIGTHVGADAGVAQAWHSARTVASITALPAHRLRSAGRNRLHGFVSQHMLLERRAEREF